jgi:hypothetical protein
LYSAAKNVKAEVGRLHEKCRGFKIRLAAVKLSEDVAFQMVASSMTVAATLFTNLQMKQTQKKPKGRRFTLEEKILSLTILKQSPKSLQTFTKIIHLAR